MKLKSSLLFLMVLFVCAFSAQSFAQKELPKTQLFLMHEDDVLPYMSDKYESALKDFVKMFSDAKVDSRSYNVIQTDYFKYTAIIPVTDFDGLAKYFGMTPEIIEKIGKDKFDAQMKKFDGCYDTHRNYLMTLRNDLSYKPEYGLNPDDGLNYRHLDYFYVVPGKENELMELIKEYKKLYESKKIEEGYRVYMGSVGTEMGMVLFVQPAKSRVDFAMLSDKQDEILGSDAQKLWNKLLTITQKFEHHDGMMRPDLSLRPKK
jgi:hypothetical protein